MPVEASGGNEEEKGLLGLLDESKGVVHVGFVCFQNNELLVPICVTSYHFVSCFCSDVNFHYFRSSGIRK
jgi:hypothetical protein